jgi:hypothetical protein
MVIDPDRLAQMRAFADEVRDDLERRELEDGPVLDQPPQETRSEPVIYKVIDSSGNGGSIAEPAALLTSDEIADAVAQALADVEADMRAEFEAALAPLRERLAAMEARIETLLALLGADPGRSKSVRKKLQDDAQHLLEAPDHRHRA